MVTPSTLVVGAGIIGCAIARELASRGVACTVVDPRPVAGGATQASAGMLAPYVEAHAGGPMLDLCVRSLDLYDDWIAALRCEGAVIDYARIGTLEIALTPEGAAGLHSGQGEWLDPAAVAGFVPHPRADGRRGAKTIDMATPTHVSLRMRSRSQRRGTARTS